MKLLLFVKGLDEVVDVLEDFPGDVAFEAAHDFSFALAFERAAETYQDGLRRAREARNLEREAMIMANLAVLAHAGAGPGHADELLEAIELYRRSYLLQEELGASGAIMTLCNLAQALVEAGEIDEASEYATRALRDSHAYQIAPARAIAVIVHAQLAIAGGKVARGLEILGAMRSDPRSPDILSQGELARVLAIHGIPLDQATTGLARGRELDLDALTEELLNGGTTRTD
jgi:tetratricopeptide (TPR) repeat protein